MQSQEKSRKTVATAGNYYDSTVATTRAPLLLWNSKLLPANAVTDTMWG